MSSDLVIHRLNTGWLYSDDTVSLYGGGRRADVPGGCIRPYGWQPAIAQPDGGTRPGTMVPAPAWLILGQGRIVLVDAGTGTAEELREMQRAADTFWTFDVTPEMHLLSQLQRFGVSADDVDVVLQTHLHFDHVGALDLFTRARIVVHAAELPWALNPPPFISGLYAPTYGRHIRDALDRMDLIEGDSWIAPGLRMVHTGGHSPGHCVVLVDTGFGQVSVAGDAVYNYRNLEYGHPQGPFVDLPAVIRSMNLLRQSEIIALNHDILFDRLFPTGRIGDAPLAPASAAYMQRLRNPRGFPSANYDDGLPKEIA